MAGDEADDQLVGGEAAAVPDAAEVLVFEVPAETSRTPVVATPENSWTSKAMEAAEATWTVTVVAGLALAEYHISPFELWPDTS